MDRHIPIEKNLQTFYSNKTMNLKNKKIFDTILKTLPSPLFFVDDNCKIQYANDYFIKLMGYSSADEIVEKEPEEILGLKKSSYIRKVLDTGNAILNKIIPIIDKNGNAMYFSMSCTSITEEKTGKIVGAYEILYDVTDLQNKEYLISQIIEKMPYPVHLVFFDINRKIQYADKDFIRLTGYKTIDEIKGKSLYELPISDKKKLIIDNVFKTNDSIINKEIEIKTVDNNTVYALCSCICIKDKVGNLIGVLEVLSDITELKNKENLIYEIIKNIPYPTKILFVDNSCRVRYANDEFAKLRGYANADQIIGKKPEEILDVKSSYIRNVLNTCVPIINKRREPLIDKDGKSLHHLMSIIPIKNKSAKIIGMLEILNDITELMEQKIVTDKILKNIPYPVHLAFFSPDKKIQYADKDYIKLLGHNSLDEIKNKNLHEILSSNYKKKLYINYVFETKKPILNKEIIIPLQLKTVEYDSNQSHNIDDIASNIMLQEKNNHMHAIYSCIPLIGTDKKMLGVLESFADITKSRCISEKLKIHQEMYSSLTQSINCSVYLIDQNCTYLYINPHYLLRFKGFEIEEIIGKSYDEFHTIEDSKQLKNKVEEVFNTEKYVEYVYHSKTDNRYFARILSPVRNNDNKIFAITVFSNEITELKKTQKTLIMKNKELEDYAHTVAHDLRTPLITMQGFTNMLEDGMEQNNKEDVAESIKYIRKAILKMDNLLSDTLKLSSINYDTSLHEMVPFNNIVIDAIEQLHVMIETQGIKLITAHDFPIVVVDKSRIIDVLINLIENSIKYMGDNNPNPIIEIGYKKYEGNSVFFVKDNGIGIDSSQYDKIFNVFYRINSNVDGTGVGLSIVKKIIGNHDSDIWVESECGKGTTFLFTLPVHKL